MTMEHLDDDLSANEGKQSIWPSLQQALADQEKASPQLLMSWACSSYEKICVAASFGKDSVVLLHMLLGIKPDIDVIFLSTGFDFDETLRYRDELQERWDLNIIDFEPLISVEEQAKNHGDELYKTDPVTCCGIRKVEPMARALKGYDAWIAGLRRDESEYRKDIGVIENGSLVKINPLANWTEDQIWSYIREFDVPYHPLYDDGFRSLGCRPCTLDGKLGRFERAGRWAGTVQEGAECGIHTQI
ncbi:MAG: phosphoadenylyl-sulfate reductase [Anaerolineales bacterium]